MKEQGVEMCKLEVAPRAAHQLTRLRVASVYLVKLDTSDLPPYPSPVAGVEINDVPHVRVSQALRVACQEKPRQVGPAEELQIHFQEREIRRNIDHTKPCAELNAVEHGTLWEVNHMLGTEIPVPVSDPAMVTVQRRILVMASPPYVLTILRVLTPAECVGVGVDT